MKAYNTVKTAKLVNEDEDTAARQAIDACIFLTPQTERDIDLALGIGTMQVDESVPVAVFDDDSLCVPEPSDAALAAIEAEQE